MLEERSLAYASVSGDNDKFGQAHPESHLVEAGERILNCEVFLALNNLVPHLGAELKTVRLVVGGLPPLSGKLLSELVLEVLVGVFVLS